MTGTPGPAGLASVRAPAAEPAGGLRQLSAQVDRPPDRLAHRADHPLRAPRPALRAAVDLVGQLDASPAGTFQALEHVTITGGQGRDTASVRTEPQWRL
jgi:hypothetical protein